MIMDENLEFCDSATASGSAGTALVGDVVDLGIGRDIGQFPDLYLVVQVPTAFASGGAATVNIQLASDAQEAIATNGSASVHTQTGALAMGELTAGKEFVYRLPIDGGASEYERYLGILVTTATATTTAGAINAFLTHDSNGRWKALANAVV